MHAHIYIRTYKHIDTYIYTYINQLSRVCVCVWRGVWCGVVWCGVVWCGVVCGVVWCGVVWCGMCDYDPTHTHTLFLEFIYSYVSSLRMVIY